MLYIINNLSLFLVVAALNIILIPVTLAQNDIGLFTVFHTLPSLPDTQKYVKSVTAGSQAPPPLDGFNLFAKDFHRYLTPIRRVIDNQIVLTLSDEPQKWFRDSTNGRLFTYMSHQPAALFMCIGNRQLTSLCLLNDISATLLKTAVSENENGLLALTNEQTGAKGYLRKPSSSNLLLDFVPSTEPQVEGVEFLSNPIHVEIVSKNIRMSIDNTYYQGLTLDFALQLKVGVRSYLTKNVTLSNGVGEAEINLVGTSQRFIPSEVYLDFKSLSEHIDITVNGQWTSFSSQKLRPAPTNLEDFCGSEIAATRNMLLVAFDKCNTSAMRPSLVGYNNNILKPEFTLKHITPKDMDFALQYFHECQPDIPPTVEGVIQKLTRPFTFMEIAGGKIVVTPTQLLTHLVKGDLTSSLDLPFAFVHQNGSVLFNDTMVLPNGFTIGYYENCETEVQYCLDLQPADQIPPTRGASDVIDLPEKSLGCSQYDLTAADIPNPFFFSNDATDFTSLLPKIPLGGNIYTGAWTRWNQAVNNVNVISVMKHVEVDDANNKKMPLKVKPKLGADSWIMAPQLNVSEADAYLFMNRDEYLSITFDVNFGAQADLERVLDDVCISQGHNRPEDCIKRAFRYKKVQIKLPAGLYNIAHGDNGKRVTSVCDAKNEPTGEFKFEELIGNENKQTDFIAFPLTASYKYWFDPLMTESVNCLVDLP
jgi:hypothetical protein